jgi:isopentenyl-diphosphate delta-isomerase
LIPSSHTHVILVDENDNEQGTMEKLAAHQKGLLHRAFSIFIFTKNHELLLQQRAFGKYHSEGLWTNTCCSHPSPGETILEAAHRRLQEEMGFDCELRESFHFMYHANLENGLTEHELDYVIIGFSDETPHLNTDEAIGFKWMDLQKIQQDIIENPSQYTYWFKQIITNHSEQLIAQITHESL